MDEDQLAGLSINWNTFIVGVENLLIFLDPKSQMDIFISA